MKARWRFVPALASKLEASQPDVFAEIHRRYTEQTGLLRSLQEQHDGKILLRDVVVVDPNRPITIAASADHEAGSNYFGCSRAIMEIATADSRAYFGKMYARELPTAFFELIAADLDGALAMEYRNYIRHQVKPCLDRITSILHANFAAIELPPLEWLVENFPGHGSVNNIVTDTIAYKIGWDSVLAQWDAQGKLDALFPPHHMMPYLAMRKLLTWSRERGESKQEQLIGMSASHKNASSAFLEAMMR
eukprot:SAG31_NODE_2242_length_6109_cov_18.408819_8_plen_248_part_00